MERFDEGSANAKKLSLKRIAIGAAMGLVLILVLCFLFAILINMEILPFRFLGGLAAVAAFLGGVWTAAFCAGKGGKLIGAFLGSALLFAVLWAAGALLFSAPVETGTSVRTGATLMISCMVGTFIAGSKK